MLAVSRAPALRDMALDDFLIAAGWHGLHAINDDVEDFKRELEAIPQDRRWAARVLVVGGSSPLIYLSRIRLLHILPMLFGDVIVMMSVADVRRV